jgi:hypothetical protein
MNTCTHGASIPKPNLLCRRYRQSRWQCPRTRLSPPKRVWVIKYAADYKGKKPATDTGAHGTRSYPHGSSNYVAGTIKSAACGARDHRLLRGFRVSGSIRKTKSHKHKRTRSSSQAQLTKQAKLAEQVAVPLGDIVAFYKRESSRVSNLKAKSHEDRHTHSSPKPHLPCRTNQKSSWRCPRSSPTKRVRKFVI